MIFSSYLRGALDKNSMNGFPNKTKAQDLVVDPIPGEVVLTHVEREARSFEMLVPVSMRLISEEHWAIEVAHVPSHTGDEAGECAEPRPDKGGASSADELVDHPENVGVHVPQVSQLPVVLHEPHLREPPTERIEEGLVSLVGGDV